LREHLDFYIGGQWVAPAAARTVKVINPATEAIAGHISFGAAADVDRAVRAAHAAFPAWSRTSREERIAVLKRVVEEYQQRYDDIARAITEEMGAPAKLSRDLQAMIGLVHLKVAIAVLETYPFEEDRGAIRIAKEPIGVCALITPWNWPINQIAAKVCPALATGCTVVLKPSEVAPFSAIVWAEVMDAARVPPGVFNLINGDGPTVGAALSAHPLVDMVSFTGSTRAGVDVAKAAASSVKRVTQELGGKSANILLPDADLDAAVTHGVESVMRNSGQSCNAPTRMLVPFARMDEAVAIAKRVAEALTVGDPQSDVALGPVVSEAQWSKIQELIAAGIEEGATLVTGGVGRPDGLKQGYFVRPTIFADVSNDMRIAREEIFGPVLAILGYDGIDDAVEIGNDTDYGLAGYVWGADIALARDVAARLRVGQVSINGGGSDGTAPFGGYKMSGNGREWGEHGFAEYLETKAMLGYATLGPQ
jgi:aldehyde dehydrogenase (NAD+)